MNVPTGVDRCSAEIRNDNHAADIAATVLTGSTETTNGYTTSRIDCDEVDDMKLLNLAVLISMTVASSWASAQSCAAPIPLAPLAEVTGNTCTAQNELGTLCIFAQSPSNDIIYSMTIVRPYSAITVALVNHTAAWNAALVLLQGACNGDSTCPRAADAGGPGADEVLDVSNLSDGTYFIVATSTASDTSCGSYLLVVDGSTPVELQSFEID